MDDTSNILNAAKFSVQDPVTEKDRVYAPGSAALWFVPRTADESFLPAWGTPRRDWVLREYSRRMYNTLFMSTLNNLGNEIASTPWQLYGKRNKNYYQKLLLNAEFGAGWRTFVKKLVNAIGTLDSGAYVEIIGRGDALKPISGRVEGIAVLDTLYCEVTGNLQYPVIFRSQTGGYHRIHTTRVRRFVDDPQSDRDFYGKGISALSRYFGFMLAQILMGRYNVEKLSDLPPAGMAVLNNIANFEEVKQQYEADRSKDGQGVFRNIMALESYDPSQKASIDFTSFAQLPEQFDYDTRMRHDYNLVALSIGVDPQDVAPLSGQSLGSGQQSFILDAKSKRKTGALLLAEIKTFLNQDVLPPYLELDFVPHDEEGAKAEADTAQAWINVINSASFLTDEQKVQVAANKIPAIQDVVTDKHGNILFTDTDVPNPEPVEDTGEDMPLDDTTTPGTDAQDDSPDGENDALSEGEDEATEEDEEETDEEIERAAVRKAYTATRDDFERAIGATVDAAVAGELTRVRAGILVRAELEKFGRRAMLDGLSDGGVDADVLEGDDLKTFNAWKVEQSAYVADLMDKIYQAGVQYTGEARGRLWSRKSLDTIYQKGLLSADANGLYEWHLGATEQHCTTCLRMNGVIKRLSQWHDDGILPQSSRLECGGFNCDCGLKRRRKKKMLTFPMLARAA